MRGRIILITLIASTLILTGCQLSDQHQIGVLKFVANSITGAIDDGGAVAVVVPAPQASEAPAATVPAATRHQQHIRLHALQHAASRMKYIESRIRSAHARVPRCVLVRTIPARVMISVNIEALRRILAGEAVTVAHKPCPRSTPSIGS